MAEPKNATTVTTPVFRASFPNLFKTRKNDLSGQDEFSIQALFEKGADLTKMKAAAQAAAFKKWGDKMPPKLRNPFRDQGEMAKEGKLPDGYVEGAIFMKFKSTNRPTVVDQNLQEILEPAKMYAGAYVRASVGAYAYDNKGNRGIAFGLNHVQLVKDGPPLSGRPTVESAFEAIQQEEEGEDATALF